jgi:hypothetical protein
MLAFKTGCFAVLVLLALLMVKIAIFNNIDIDWPLTLKTVI